MKKYLYLYFILFLLPLSCKQNKRFINSDKDQSSLDSLVNKFYLYQKKKNYGELFKLFTLGNSKLSRASLNNKLLILFKDIENKDGEIIKQLSKSYKTDVTTSDKGSIGIYEAEIDNERRYFLSRESFKVMLENDSLKIYDYQIAIKEK